MVKLKKIKKHKALRLSRLIKRKLLNGKTTSQKQQVDTVNDSTKISTGIQPAASGCQEKNQQTETKTASNDGSSMQPADNNNPWFVIGASVTGNSHKTNNTPCQDAHKTEAWGKGWGVAVVSDGAGSAEKSHYASAFLVEEAAKKTKELVEQKGWMKKDGLPDNDQWDIESRKLIGKIKDALADYAKELKTPLEQMHATIIVVIFSPKGLLTVHVGDGRAGYMNNSNELKPVITPFEGEQVGQTAFITLDIENFKHIVEANVIDEPVKAFFILSDGCESVCWETIKKDPETEKFFKPNQPFKPFFEHTIKALECMQEENSLDELPKKWFHYLNDGHKGFQTEPDDKTMVIGINVESKNSFEKSQLTEQSNTEMDNNSA